MKTRDATAAYFDFRANAFLRAMRPYITAARRSWDQVKEDRQFREQLHLSSTRIILDEGNSVGFYMTRDKGHDLALPPLCILPQSHRYRPASAVLWQISSYP